MSIADQRIGTVVKNLMGFDMMCIAYRNSMDIDVLFLDEEGHIAQHVQWNNFIRGKVRNGARNLFRQNHFEKDNKIPKEYYTWKHMLERCFSAKFKASKPTYMNASCCKQWLNYSAFCNWLYDQDNFETWMSLEYSCLDKDILIKGNKLYSPDTCLLVPSNVNTLFVKRNGDRGLLPIGVIQLDSKYGACCANPFEKRTVTIGRYDTVKDAFVAYKTYKENIIRQVADIEYNKQTITKTCKDAMYAYRVEIDD